MKPGVIASRPHPISESKQALLKQIVVPTDFTHTSHSALAYALALSKTYGSKLTALHAVDPIDYQFGPKELRDLQRQQVWTAARDIMGSWLKSASNSVDSVLMEGDPALVLAKFAAEKNVDLVVLGTAGRQNGARALFGSVAEEVF